jgi:hypothetical protein
VIGFYPLKNSSEALTMSNFRLIDLSLNYEHYTGYAPIHATIGLENLRIWWSGVDEEAKTEAGNWRAMTVGLKTSAKRKSGAMHSRGLSKRRGLEHR